MNAQGSSVWRPGQAPRAGTTSGALLGALLLAGLAAVATRIANKALARRHAGKQRCEQGSGSGGAQGGGAPTATGAETDPVTASGNLIAAWRALESMEPEPLFVDPLAAAMAGPAVGEALRLAQPFPSGLAGGAAGGKLAAAGAADAVAAAAAAAAEGSSSSSSSSSSAAAAAGSAGQAGPQQQRRLKVSNVASRCWWFDRQLAAALAAQPGGASPPRQVVVLGAGFDTRPWRLALPPGVRWWEVDMPKVVAAKMEQLRQLGAALEAGGDGAAAHPLRAASWAALPADLGQPGWTEALQMAGFDPSQPTVWIAEGLLMYLDMQQMGALLAEAAGASAPGSALVAHNITTELLGLIQSDLGAAAYAPFPPELVATWRSGHPPASDRSALAAALAASGGWRLREAASRAAIAAQIVARCTGRGADEGDGSGAAGVAPSEVGAWIDFEARPGVGIDRWSVFFTAVVE